MEAIALAEQFEFRMIRQEETEQAVQIEQICFPPHEACSRESMQRRIAAVPELFLVAVDRTAGRIAGFLNGISTEESIFRDEFFTNETLHDPKGKNVMLLGLDVLPEYRGRGLAKAIVSRYIEQEKEKALEDFEMTVKPDIIAEIEGRENERINAMKAELDKKSAENLKLENLIKEQRIYISSNYEAYLGKEYVTVEKLTELKQVMISGGAATVAQALAVYREKHL